MIFCQALGGLRAALKRAARSYLLRLAPRIVGIWHSARNELFRFKRAARNRLKFCVDLIAPVSVVRIEMIDLTESALKGIALHFLNALRQDGGFKSVPLPICRGKNLRISRNLCLQKRGLIDHVVAAYVVTGHFNANTVFAWREF